MEVGGRVCLSVRRHKPSVHGFSVSVSRMRQVSRTANDHTHTIKEEVDVRSEDIMSARREGDDESAGCGIGCVVAEGRP